MPDRADQPTRQLGEVDGQLVQQRCMGEVVDRCDGSCERRHGRLYVVRDDRAGTEPMSECPRRRDAAQVERDFSPGWARTKGADFGEVRSAVDLVRCVERISPVSVGQQICGVPGSRPGAQHGVEGSLSALMARKRKAGDVQNHSMYPKARNRDSTSASLVVTRRRT